MIVLSYSYLNGYGLILDITRQNSAQSFAVEKGKISVKASWRQSRKAMQERAEKRARGEPIGALVNL